MGAWIRLHPVWAVFICIGATLGTLSLISLKYPVVKERVLKPIFAGISVGIVAVVYLTVFAATAISLKLFGRRLLPDFRKKNPPTYWTEREKTEPTLDYLKRQF